MRTTLALLLLLGVPGPVPAQQATHVVPLSPETVHWGHYDAALDPVLRIQSGDRVSFGALVARGLERLRMAGARDEDFTPDLLAVEEGVQDRGPGAHPLTGPVYVDGAEPGDVLEVRIEEVHVLSSAGVSGFLPGGGTIPGDFPYAALRLFDIDAEAGVVRMVGTDLTVSLRPFFGSIGVAPPLLRGRISSTAPGYHGGNFDNKDLVAGTTLFLPVHAPGGLLSIGDGHAAQGDGEVTGTAVEASLGGTIQVLLHKDTHLRWPRAETSTHYMSMGLDPDLDEAARLATREMVDFLVARHGLDPADAYVLCSVALDLRVTQLVDGTKGIHGLLAKSIFER